MRPRIILFYLAFFLTSCLFLHSCDKRSIDSKHGYSYFLTPDEKYNLKEGDIIMRQGHGVVSSMIIRMLNEEIPVSHIGIVYKDSIGKFYVIHSVSRSISDHDGIQSDRLDIFVNQSRNNSVIVTRYKNDSPGAGVRISERALYYLEQKIPFDHSFDISNPDAFYCTELIWRILMDVFDDDIIPGDAPGDLIKWLKFAPFFDQDRFEIIIDHQNSDNSKLLV